MTRFLTDRDPYSAIRGVAAELVGVTSETCRINHHMRPSLLRRKERDSVKMVPVLPDSPIEGAPIEMRTRSCSHMEIKFVYLDLK